MIETETWHGSRYGYVRMRCRCEPCVVANRNYQREYMRAWRATKELERRAELRRKRQELEC